MRLFLLLSLLALGAAAPSALSEEAIDPATDGLASTVQPALLSETDSQETESQEEKFEIEQMTSFESFRKLNNEAGAKDDAPEVKGDGNEEENVSEDEEASLLHDTSDEKKTQRRRRSTNEEESSSSTEKESSEESKESSEDKVGASSKTSEETVKNNSAETEETSAEKKEEHDGERKRRDLEEAGQEATASPVVLEEGEKVKLASGEHMTDGHIVREDLKPEDQAADEKARKAMETEHMAAIHAMEAIVERMKEEASN